MNFIHTIIGALAVIGNLLFPSHQAAPKLQAAPQFTAAKPSSLYGGGISSSDTSIKLVALVTPAGAAINTGDAIGGVGSYVYGTIEPASSRKETVACTAITQNSDGTATLTGCSRGMQFTYPYTASTTLALSHAGGSRFVLSDSPQLYQDIIAYANTITAAGVVDASGIAKGIVEISTAAEASSHTAIGGGNTSAPLVLASSISSSTRTVNTAQVVISSSTDGYIDQSYLKNIPVLNIANTFTGSNTFATSSTATTTIGAFPAWEIGKQVQIFTSSGTFSVPTGITKIHYRMVGGGGGGAQGATTANGSGGEAGAYGEGWLSTSATTSIKVTIGALGTGHTGSQGVGTAGTATVFGNIICSGGSGGSDTSTVASSAVCTNADFYIAGQGSNNTIAGAPGLGGSNPLGNGGIFGAAAQGYGGGGGPGTGAATNAGNGTAGILLLNW